jgi:hypothetical protein
VYNHLVAAIFEFVQCASTRAASVFSVSFFRAGLAVLLECSSPA